MADAALNLGGNYLKFSGLSGASLTLTSSGLPNQGGYEQDGIAGVQIVDASPVTYALTATPGSNGLISPSGTTRVNEGANQTYTIIPASGFVMNVVTVDGVAQSGHPASFTFANVITSHTISATFSQIFSGWISGYPAVDTATAFTDDPDHDGIRNGIENYLGTNPAQSSAGLTVLSSMGSVFKFMHTRNQNIAADIIPVYQWSTDLENWFTSGQTNAQNISADITSQVVALTAAPASDDMIEVTMTVTIGTPTSIFVRILASQTP
jgi:hypothetical protein